MNLSQFVKPAPKLWGLLLIAIAALLASSCQEELAPVDPSLTYIPKETAMVSAIRLQQLMDKAGFESLKGKAAYQEMLAEAEEESAVLAKVLERPSTSGVDLSGNAYISALLSDTTGMFVVMALPLADEKAFGELIESMDTKAVPARNGFRIAGGLGEATVAWNKEVALVGLSQGGPDAKARLERLLDTPPANSVAENKSLRKSLAGESYDIMAWYSSDFILGNEAALLSGKMLNYKEADLRGQYITQTITFEEGAISSKIGLELSGPLKNDLDMFFRDEVATDFVSMAPAGEPVFFMTAAFDMNGINQLLIEKYSKGLVGELLEGYGVPTADVLEVLDGDIMLAAYDFEQMVFGAKLDDESLLMEHLAKAQEEQGLQELSPGRYRFLKVKTAAKKDSLGQVLESGVNIDAQILIKDGLLFLSTTPELLDRVARGEQGIRGQLANRASGLVNKHIFTALGAPLPLAEWDDDLKKFQSVDASADRDGLSFRVELDKPGQNSLRQLIEAAERKNAESEL